MSALGQKQTFQIVGGSPLYPRSDNDWSRSHFARRGVSKRVAGPTVGPYQLRRRSSEFPASVARTNCSRQKGGVMRIKSLTMYSLLFVVGIVGILVAVHQFVPTLRGLSQFDTNAKNGTISGQAVNRSRKSNRLPIQSTTPQAPAKGQMNAPVQTRVIIIV